MAKIIEARVIQKVATEAEWLQTTLPLYQGEIALVRSGDRVVNMKVGNGTAKFSELNYVYNGGFNGSINPSTATTELQNGFYFAEVSGTYNNAGGIVVQEGYYTILEKYSGGWKKSTEVKMPEMSPTGKIEEGNTQAVSGGEVYNKIEVINDLIANISGQIGSGIIGEAFPVTIPISEGFGIYTVSTSGTFVNFNDVNNNPLIVSQADLDSGLVQLWGNNNIWEKHITLVDVFTPIFSDNLSDI